MPCLQNCPGPLQAPPMHAITQRLSTPYPTLTNTREFQTFPSIEYTYRFLSMFRPNLPVRRWLTPHPSPVTHKNTAIPTCCRLVHTTPQRPKGLRSAQAALIYDSFSCVAINSSPLRMLFNTLLSPHNQPKPSTPIRNAHHPCPPRAHFPAPAALRALSAILHFPHAKVYPLLFRAVKKYTLWTTMWIFTPFGPVFSKTHEILAFSTNPSVFQHPFTSWRFWTMLLEIICFS